MINRFDEDPYDDHGECRAEITRLRAELAAARDAALEESALLAAQHDPPRTKRNFGMGDEFWQEIVSEQRGEKIAAQIISKAIRSLKGPTDD